MDGRLMEKLLKFSQVRELLNVSTATLYRLIWDGRIPAVKIGGCWRFREEDIEQVLAHSRERRIDK